jgi:RNA polymerase sigma factor (sigma-70 family)
MKYARRVEIFKQVRAEYGGFLAAVLWKLTGDRELFAEALQYALLGMWRNVEKLNGERSGAYIYRIALTANSAAWRNRIGKDGQISKDRICIQKAPGQKAGERELAAIVRKTIAELPLKQGRAIVMRYLEQQSYESIAEKLRCSEAGARSNVSKALAALKAKLANFSEKEQ